MQSSAKHNHGTLDLRRALERLDGLPIRPVSARAVLAHAAIAAEDLEPSPVPRFLDHDPGLAVDVLSVRPCASKLRVVADRPWWRSEPGAVAESLESLWRHALAVSISTKRLAAEAGHADADTLAGAGLIHQLGLWAIAAVSPAHLVDLVAIHDRNERRTREALLLGRDASALGADLARRWGLGEHAVAAAWLHADEEGNLERLSADPLALRIIQQAYGLAERTPWAMFPRELSDRRPTDPLLKLLIAEVQVRASAGLLDPEANPHEEAISRDHARLALRYAQLKTQADTQGRLLKTMAAASPIESPDQWTERAGRVWCEEPGIASAKVVWRASAEESAQTLNLTGGESSRAKPRLIPLGRSGRPSSELHVWTSSEDSASWSPSEDVIAAWGAWSDLIAERDRRSRDLDEAVTSHRASVARDRQAERVSRMEALAEFAGGAGHELNNPLAVIVGRAQLLIPKVAEPDAAKSLRIIINQAQRAHRILRDLMYVARPPTPRLRPCQPDEILRGSLRDMKDEAEARGVRLVAETQEPTPVGWTDPDTLRHLADVLIRNALEATPSGGCVRVTSGREAQSLKWVVKDSGRGITAHEASRLFDPFFCGRQAGRGLGLGLPRAFRFASQVGGTLTWKSNPGQGTLFTVEIPVEMPPSW